MRKIFVITLLLMIASTAVARDADIKVSYKFFSNSWASNARISDNFILLANVEESRFFSPITQIVDSMLSTSEGTRHFNDMVEAANNAGKAPELLPESRTYVIKNRNKKTVTHYDENGEGVYYYTESPDELKWNIKDESKEILGYQCFLAETDYHGRHWKSWFTPQIPIPDGPWKFQNLPGLILEAESDNNAYHILAVGIEENKTPFPKVIYGFDYAERKDRKKALLIQWNFYYVDDDTAQMGVSSMWQATPPEGFDLIEKDYRQ